MIASANHAARATTSPAPASVTQTLFDCESALKRLHSDQPKLVEAYLATAPLSIGTDRGTAAQSMPVSSARSGVRGPGATQKCLLETPPC